MPAFFGAEEIWGRRSDGEEAEKVILVGVWALSENEFHTEEDFRHSLDELEDLAKACRMDPCCRVTQQLPAVDKALYVRSGKAEEIAALADAWEAGRVIFNEINTMPGFTSISMYPMLWEEQGYPIRELVEELIQSAWSDFGEGEE